MMDTFYNFMRQFLEDKKPESLIEVGSDIQLRVAASLAPYCGKMYSVNFPNMCERMQGWFKLHQKMNGVSNLELIAGNAVQLSTLIPHADVILLHNLLIGPSETDMRSYGQFIRGDRSPIKEKSVWGPLWRRFKQAEKQALQEFLKVANPGYIVTFMRSNPNEEYQPILKLKKPYQKIPLRYSDAIEDNNKDWVLYIIENKV